MGLLKTIDAIIKGFKSGKDLVSAHKAHSRGEYFRAAKTYIGVAKYYIEISKMSSACREEGEEPTVKIDELIGTCMLNAGLCLRELGEPEVAADAFDLARKRGIEEDPEKLPGNEPFAPESMRGG